MCLSVEGLRTWRLMKKTVSPWLDKACVARHKRRLRNRLDELDDGLLINPDMGVVIADIRRYYAFSKLY